MQTAAAIDVGSNGIRMIVGGINAENEVETLESLRIPVRLGQDVFTDGQIGETSMQAALDAFLRFHNLATQFEVERVRAIGTSAMREAENSNVLIERIRQATGIQVEIISGEEESRLIHLAIARTVDLEDKRAVLIDIGGGSIEVAISQGNQIVSAESYALGTVRLLRRLDDTANHRPFHVLLREYTESARRNIKRRFGNQKFDLCVGTGGNLEELGILRKRVLKRATDHSISARDLASLTDRIAQMSFDERMTKLNLRFDRADVILPAAMVLSMILKEAGIKEIQIPGVGLKEGVLWDMVPALTGPHVPRREQIWLSAMRLGEKYQFDREHGARVTRTARRLFDQSTALHGLEPEERILLEVGSLLHDIGHFISSLNHEMHGAYIVKNSSFIGLDERSRDIVVQLIRYHRKLVPGTQDEEFKALPAKDRQTVMKLSALLRLADAIEVSHTSRIHGVTLKEGEECWELKLHGESGLLLEKWTLEKRKGLFEEVFGETLKVME